MEVTFNDEDFAVDKNLSEWILRLAENITEKEAKNLKTLELGKANHKIFCILNHCYPSPPKRFFLVLMTFYFVCFSIGILGNLLVLVVNIYVEFRVKIFSNILI